MPCRRSYAQVRGCSSMGAARLQWAVRPTRQFPPGEPDPVQKRLSLGGDLLAGTTLHLNRRLYDVREHSHVREQVEALEDHADAESRLRGLALLLLVELPVALGVANELTVDVEPPGIDLLQVIDA